MRDYEVVYIFHSALAPEEIEGKLDRYHGILSKDGGQVTAVEHWGKRQLAYPIQNESSGYYVVAQFTAEPAVLSELEALLKLDEQLLRHLIVLSEGEPPVPSSMQELEKEKEENKEEEAEEAETEVEAEAEAEDEEE